MQYIVKQGDTLKSIADYYGIDIKRIKEYNNLNDENIEEGMIINIPIESPFQYYKVLEGDDLYTISNKFLIPVEFLSKINGLKVGEYIYPNQELLVPKIGNKIYLTSKGDSINSIANKLGINTLDIINNNKELYLVEDQLIIYKERG